MSTDIEYISTDNYNYLTLYCYYLCAFFAQTAPRISAAMEIIIGSKEKENCRRH